MTQQDERIAQTGRSRRRLILEYDVGAMLRQLFHIVCTVSLVLCLLAAGAWARSHWRRYDVEAGRREFFGTQRHADFHLTQGCVHLYWSCEGPYPDRFTEGATPPFPPASYEIRWNGRAVEEVGGAGEPNPWGFAFYHSNTPILDDTPLTSTFLTFPAWLAVVVTAPGALVAMTRLVRVARDWRRVGGKKKNARPRRGSVIFLTVILTTLALVALGVWARSYFRGYHAEYEHELLPGDKVTLHADVRRGVVYVGGGREFGKTGEPPNYSMYRLLWNAADAEALEWNKMWHGFSLDHHPAEHYPPKPYVDSDATSLSFPLWAVALACAPISLVWLRSSRRRRRRGAGRCLVCGYDLRASSEKCPECGTPIPADHAAMSSPRTSRRRGGDDALPNHS